MRSLVAILVVCTAAAACGKQGRCADIQCSPCVPGGVYYFVTDSSTDAALTGVTIDGSACSAPLGPTSCMEPYRTETKYDVVVAAHAHTTKTVHVVQLGALPPAPGIGGECCGACGATTSVEVALDPA